MVNSLERYSDISQKDVITREDDLLDMVDSAIKFSKFLRLRIQRNFVVSLHSDYGTGKTFYLKLLKSELESSAVKVIYFNAWENDDDDPFKAFIAEINKTFKEKDSGKTNDMLSQIRETGGEIRKKYAPAIAKILAKIALKLVKIDSDTIKEIVEVVNDAAELNFEKSVEEYEKHQQSKKYLKDLMLEFKNEVSPSNNIIIIVDELDRCKPTYSVELLETIKHFFSVEGYTFILSADYTQITNTIKKVYGEIDADNYLRKFIDMQFHLPEINKEKYAELLLMKYFDQKELYSGFKIILNKGIKTFDLKLREIEKIIFNFSAVVLQSEKNTLQSIYLLSLLLIIKIRYPIIYKDLIANNYNNLIYLRDKRDEFEKMHGGVVIKIFYIIDNNNAISEQINYHIDDCSHDVIYIIKELKYLEFLEDIEIHDYQK